MITIRKNTFETNSSSTHSIAISKELVGEVSGKHIHFHLNDYGWEIGCVDDTASYLYSAIMYIEDSVDRLESLKKALDSLGVTYEFDEPTISWCGIDHGNNLYEFVDAVLSDTDLLKRYLFGDASCIYTGNDNSCDYEDSMCFCACEESEFHDESKYDYFFKDN